MRATCVRVPVPIFGRPKPARSGAPTPAADGPLVPQAQQRAARPFQLPQCRRQRTWRVPALCAHVQRCGKHRRPPPPSCACAHLVQMRFRHPALGPVPPGLRQHASHGSGRHAPNFGDNGVIPAGHEPAAVITCPLRPFARAALSPGYDQRPRCPPVASAHRPDMANGQGIAHLFHPSKGALLHGACVGRRFAARPGRSDGETPGGGGGTRLQARPSGQSRPMGHLCAGAGRRAAASPSTRALGILPMTILGQQHRCLWSLS